MNDLKNDLKNADLSDFKNSTHSAPTGRNSRTLEEEQAMLTELVLLLTRAGMQDHPEDDAELEAVFRTADPVFKAVVASSVMAGSLDEQELTPDHAALAANGIVEDHTRLGEALLHRKACWELRKKGDADGAFDECEKGFLAADHKLLWYELANTFLCLHPEKPDGIPGSLGRDIDRYRSMKTGSAKRLFSAVFFSLLFTLAAAALLYHGQDFRFTLVEWLTGRPMVIIFSVITIIFLFWQGFWSAVAVAVVSAMILWGLDALAGSGPFFAWALLGLCALLLLLLAFYTGYRPFVRNLGYRKNMRRRMEQFLVLDARIGAIRKKLTAILEATKNDSGDTLEIRYMAARAHIEDRDFLCSMYRKAFQTLLSVYDSAQLKL